MAQRFANTLSRKAGLGNLRNARDTTPLLVVKDAGIYKEKYRNGLVLEIWVHRWGFHFTPVDFKTYSITLNAKARLTQIEDGRVLWNVGNCSYGGSGSGYDDHIVLSDLNSSDKRKVQAKIKQTVARIADECARQLMQDFSASKK